jgi:hypothetical protein
MTTKELIKAEVDRVSDEDLEELYSLVKSFTEAKVQDDQQEFMAQLRSIQIDDAPEDFATNFDLYMSGEKRVGQDIR